MPTCYGLIVMPTYNDWVSCRQLIEALDAVLVSTDTRTYRVMIIDDGSTEPPVSLVFENSLQRIERIDILHLKRNLGHQRAICIALSYIYSNIPCEAVILMDSDGEDDPEDVPNLLERFEREHREAIVFARRTKRSEYWLFRFFLRLYKITHRLLTGRGIYVGNFSVIPWRLLSPLITLPELWSHYAAAVMHAKLPYELVPAARAKRLDGSSHMSFTNLIIHGLSAVSVYSETIGIRLLIASGISILLVIAGLIGAITLTSIADQITLGWAAFSGGLLLVVLMQIVMFAMGFSFLILSGRKNAGFIPVRDYHFFVGNLNTIWTSQQLPLNT